MNTVHLWFRSGRYTLLGHLDIASQSRRIGVVMVPPFGWEDICSYRPLRFFAQSFAAIGISTLRYDLPGTGDSTGDACDAGLLDSWIESIADAATELRKAAEVEEVAAVGVHLGAMLALAAASRKPCLDHLVLWGAAARGRTILRELRAAANVERWESMPDPPALPLAGLESGGFLMSPETVEGLEHFDVTRLPDPTARRILLLSRDELPHDPKLVEVLRSSVESVEIATGVGYSAMMAQPQEAAIPRQTGLRIAEFLDVEVKATTARPVRFPAQRAEIPESICRIEHSTAEMFGVLTEPSVRHSDCGLLYLNAGGVRHVGPNRMWVESARRWAERGVVSLRLDLLGIGESDGREFLDIPALYRQCLMDQIETAIQALRATGVRKFLPVGLCAGACWGFHAALRNPDVCAAILINPSLLYWDPAVDRRRVVKLISGGVTRWAECAAMIRGGFQRGDIQRGVRRVADRLRRGRTKPGVDLELGFASLADAWSHLEREGKRVTLIFREGEPLLEELESDGQLPPEDAPLLRWIRVPNGGHTFRPLWAQKMAHDRIDQEIARVIAEPAPVSDDLLLAARGREK